MGAVKLMTVEEALKDVTKLGIDTSPIIYFVQSHPTYDVVVSAIFHQIAAGNIEAITSTLTLTDILSWPIQQGNPQLQAQYRTLLTTSPHFTLVNIDATVAETAAHLRAKYRLRTPDALQISAALTTGCQAFLTNDKDLRRVTELHIVVVDELL